MRSVSKISVVLTVLSLCLQPPPAVAGRVDPAAGVSTKTPRHRASKMEADCKVLCHAAGSGKKKGQYLQSPLYWHVIQIVDLDSMARLIWRSFSTFTWVLFSINIHRPILHSRTKRC